MTNETEKLCLVKSEFCQSIINRTLATIAETSIGFFTIMIISKIFSVNIPLFLGGDNYHSTGIMLDWCTYK